MQHLGVRLEDDDDPRLVELGDAAVDELEAEQALAAAGRPGDEDQVAPPDAAVEQEVEAGDAGPDAVGLGHDRRLRGVAA
ncbi:MAG: hypothetical protein ABMA64_29610 [Myxococcota bacterium]